MVVYDKKIHLFTKGWAQETIDHYVIELPEKTETGKTIKLDATFRESIEKGNLLITGADIDITGNLVLLGYEETDSAVRDKSLVKLMYFQRGFDSLKKVKPIKYILDTKEGYKQMEAICFKRPGLLYLANDNEDTSQSSGLYHVRFP